MRNTYSKTFISTLISLPIYCSCRSVFITRAPPELIRLSHLIEIGVISPGHKLAVWPRNLRNLLYALTPAPRHFGTSKRGCGGAYQILTSNFHSYCCERLLCAAAVITHFTTRRERIVLKLVCDSYV